MDVDHIIIPLHAIAASFVVLTTAWVIAVLHWTAEGQGPRALGGEPA